MTLTGLDTVGRDRPSYSTIRTSGGRVATKERIETFAR